MRDSSFPEFSVLGVIRISVIAILVLACIKVIQPFLGALTWAVIITISVWPFYKWLCQKLKRHHKWAALIVVIVLTLSIAVPIGLLTMTIAEAIPQSANLVHDLSNYKLPAPPNWLGNLPFVGDSSLQFWHSLQTDFHGVLNRMRPLFNKAAIWILERGASAGYSLLEIVLAIIISGLLLINGHKLWLKAEKTVTKLGGEMAGDLPYVIARTIRGVSTGVIGTALAQTVLCVIGLLIAQVPGALVLGFICFVIAVAQLPTFLVWLPAALWVFYTGNNGLGIFLLAWGFILVNSIDNILKPYLISHGAQMPLFIIFMGVIGGLVAWGLIGLFIGPTLLAVALTIYRHWLRGEETNDLITSPEDDS